MSHVLFVCIQNAGRSQMAQALFERAADGRHEARSAGSRPAAPRPSRGGRRDARARDRRVSDDTPHQLDRDDMHWADLVVTMGCGDECPFVPGKRYIDWELDDPSGRPADDVRRIRDDIATRVDVLLADLASGEEVSS